MIITMAAAAIALATGVQAVDVTQAWDSNPVDWDGTFQLWTNEAKQAGYGYAYDLNVHPYDSDPMGVWNSNAHTVAAIARDMGITTDGLANALLQEGNWYRSEVLYFEQLTLISACLTNINDTLKPHFRYIEAEFDESKGPPSMDELTGFIPPDTKIMRRTNDE